MTGAERTDLAALARDYFEALRVLGKHSTCPSCGDRLPAARGHRCARRIGRQFLARAGGGGGMARMKILDEGRSAPEARDLGRPTQRFASARPSSFRRLTLMTIAQAGRTVLRRLRLVPENQRPGVVRLTRLRRRNDRDPHAWADFSMMTTTVEGTDDGRSPVSSLRTLERHGCAALVNCESDSSVGRGVGWVAVGLVRGITGTPDPDPDGVVGIGRARYPGEGVAGRPVHLHRPGRSVPEPPLELIGRRAPGCARGDGDGRARQLWP